MESRIPLVAIVDDEESIRTALVRLFRFSHYRTEVFASCMEFLEYSTQHEEPDCLVLDMRMPGMRGIELVRRLSRSNYSPPLIVITGDAEESTKEECKALGVRHYFSKPFEGKALLKSVNEIVGVAPSRHEASVTPAAEPDNPAG